MKLLNHPLQRVEAKTKFPSFHHPFSSLERTNLTSHLTWSITNN